MNRFGLQATLVITAIAMFSLMFYGLYDYDANIHWQLFWTISLFIVLLVLDYGDKRNS